MHFLSVCKEPIYIEAREVSTEKDWIGSNSLILHQVKNTEDWELKTPKIRHLDYQKISGELAKLNVFQYSMN